MRTSGVFLLHLRDCNTGKKVWTSALLLRQKNCNVDKGPYNVDKTNAPLLCRKNCNVESQSPIGPFSLAMLRQMRRRSIRQAGPMRVA